ncbi:MAG: hypothetical protein HY039_01975 [Nitrospirae bacterium]|nr:hypothetical protein [Nitrospirota bacterium]
MNPAIERELRERLDRLAPGQQRQVLNFARELAREKPGGVPGKILTRFGGTIAKDDLAAIERAIEEEGGDYDRICKSARD